MSNPAGLPEGNRVHSAPRNTEEARTLMQARLALFGRIGMTIGAVFLGFLLVAYFVLRIPGSIASMLAQAASGSVGAGVWLLTRGRIKSSRALEIIDVVAVMGTCGIFITLGFAIPFWARPELIQLLCVTDVLVLRAFLVPSTTRKTAILGSMVALSVLVCTWSIYSRHRPHPDAPGTAGYVVIASFFSIGMVLLTALTSRTIFGLRQRVREAAQLGQYTLLEKIGEGGMGIVYKARHAMLRRPTAIKLLPADRAGENNLARFEREVQLTSLLTHPNTVSIYDYGRTASGVLYYAMEYLNGIDLQALVELDGRQDPGRVVHLLRQISGALEEAHDVGLIHRDIKPANVLLCSRTGADVVKVLDFGLVKSLEGPDNAAATAVNQIVGTPLYMSPEAIATPDQVDARSDLYALGALGYFLLVGQPPFSAASALEVCGHHLHTVPTPPSERLGQRVPASLERLILACLAKSADGRPQSARAIAVALDGCSDVPPWTAEKTVNWWRTRATDIRDRAARGRQGVSAGGSEQTVAIDLRLRETQALAN